MLLRKNNNGTLLAFYRSETPLAALPAEGRADRDQIKSHFSKNANGFS
jgi:hypothetical protein